jgi:MFS family permease
MPRSRGWMMLASLWSVIFLNFGFTAYAPAVVNAAMANAVGLNRQTLGEMFAVYMVMSGLPGPLVGMSVNRIGVRKTLVLGSGLIISGAVLMATIVTGGMGAMLCFGMLIGLGNVTGSLLPSQTALARRFVLRRSLALATLYSGGALGGFAAAPLVSYFIHRSGTWRGGWWIIAAASAVAAGIALLSLRESPRDQVNDELSQTNAEPASSPDARPEFVSRHEWTFREAVRNPTYWLILLSFVGASGGNTLFLAHGVAHLEDLGHSATAAAWAVSVITVSGLAGKALLAALGDRIDPRYLLAGFLAVFGIGLSSVVTAHAVWEMLFSTACLGIGFGGGFVCLMTLVSNYYGTHAFPLLAGTMTAIPTALSALIATVAGRLFDLGVGYGMAFYALAIWCICGAFILTVIHRPARLEVLHRCPV